MVWGGVGCVVLCLHDIASRRVVVLIGAQLHSRTPRRRLEARWVARCPLSLGTPLPFSSSLKVPQARPVIVYVRIGDSASAPHRPHIAKGIASQSPRDAAGLQPKALPRSKWEAVV